MKKKECVSSLQRTLTGFLSSFYQKYCSAYNHISTAWQWLLQKFLRENKANVLEGRERADKVKLQAKINTDSGIRHKSFPRQKQNQ